MRDGGGGGGRTTRPQRSIKISGRLSKKRVRWKKLGYLTIGNKKYMRNRHRGGTKPDPDHHKKNEKKGEWGVKKRWVSGNTEREESRKSPDLYRTSGARLLAVGG